MLDAAICVPPSKRDKIGNRSYTKGKRINHAIRCRALSDRDNYALAVRKSMQLECVDGRKFAHRDSSRVLCRQTEANNTHTNNTKPEDRSKRAPCKQAGETGYQIEAPESRQYNANP